MCLSVMGGLSNFMMLCSMCVCNTGILHVFKTVVSLLFLEMEQTKGEENYLFAVKIFTSEL